MKFKVLLFVFLTSIAVNSFGDSISKKNDSCRLAMSEIESKQHSILKNNTADRFVKADEEWGKANSCASSPEEKAMMADLYGDIAYLMYRDSEGKSEIFDASMEAYRKALSFNTSRNSAVHLHMGRLLSAAGSHDKAVEQVELAKSGWVGDTYSYWAFAFGIYADAGQWEGARTAFFALAKKDKEFYSDPALMLAAVKVYCNYGQLEEAIKMVRSNKEYMEESGNAQNEAWAQLLEMANKVIKNCPKQSVPV